ncbi:lasso peptide biosynthesis B2 protein [Croceicoccus ponticola]|uniref:Lasso peptide biosynthesis B2 protein n=1 Tax=Croceicoccus ponticola TaxID=2217664 RepID=A0A437GXD7_9SPHN|nr:lasso peptide biosynthesis B2 protein [Croceicoccus ponticola]RVQ67063.1 lasso peptide biosynthesis B2 protein [Croceicoccus ponticola]
MIRVRLRTLEAMALALIARLLIRFVPLARWSQLLGESIPAGQSADIADHDETADTQTDEMVRACAAAVRRATMRMPGTICLPQAIALQWMLARRRIGSAIILGFVPLARRGVGDDLHAWVEWNGRKIIGDTGDAHARLLQFRTSYDSGDCNSGTFC